MTNLDWTEGGPSPDEDTTDQQVDAIVKASGHTWADAELILSNLNRAGWTVCQTLKEQTA